MEAADRILAIPNKNALWRRMRFYEITGKKDLKSIGVSLIIKNVFVKDACRRAFIVPYGARPRFGRPASGRRKKRKRRVPVLQGRALDEPGGRPPCGTRCRGKMV